MIQVAPDSQVGKHPVGRIYLAVEVQIQVLESVEAVDSKLPVALQRIHTEKLATRIDQVVSVAVQHQPTVVRPDPTSSSLDTIVVVIEKNDGPVAGAGGFYAVAIKVKHKGIAARWGCAARTTAAAGAARPTSRTAPATRSSGSTTWATWNTCAATRATATSAGQRLPPFFRIQPTSLRIFQLIVHMLGILTCAVRTLPTHRANGITNGHPLTKLNIL